MSMSAEQTEQLRSLFTAMTREQRTQLFGVIKALKHPDPAVRSSVREKLGLKPEGRSHA